MKSSGNSSNITGGFFEKGININPHSYVKRGAHEKDNKPYFCSKLTLFNSDSPCLGTNRWRTKIKKEPCIERGSKSWLIKV